MPARISPDDPSLVLLDGWGLDIVLKNCEQSANDTLAQVRREVRNNGVLAGWKTLSELLPHWGLHPQMVSDALMTVKVYQTVQGVDRVDTTSKLKMTVKSNPSPTSLTEIGPKSIGGQAWKSDTSYAELQETWNGLRSSSLPPCPVWIWVGMIKKVIAKADHDAVGALHMMSTVDYDFDRNPATKAGFDHTMMVAATCAENPTHHGLRGAALAALFSFDIQKVVRKTQEKWLIEKKGAYNFGTRDVDPRDWVAGAVGDCAGLSPFGYLSCLDYARGKVAMFLAMAMANSHDILFDICSQNRMSSVLYAAATGSAMQDMHSVFLQTVMDEVARRVSGLRRDEPALYGDSAALCTCAWAPFNGRYRTWERFIKYHRLLEAAEDPKHSVVLDYSTRQIVFKDYNIDADDVVKLWEATAATTIQKETQPRMLYIDSVAFAFDIEMSSQGRDGFEYKSSVKRQRTEYDALNTCDQADDDLMYNSTSFNGYKGRKRPHSCAFHENERRGTVECEALDNGGLKARMAAHLEMPALCSGCFKAFANHMTRSGPELHSAIKFSESTLKSPSVIWAATISFISRWATEQTCCNSCAIKIGIWADEVSYIVLVELMKSEAVTDSKTWLLHQYAAWCTAAAPISVASVLTGFDLRADIRVDDGAMGERDTVDC